MPQTKYVKVYIDGQQLDLAKMDDLPVAINYKLEDPGDFQKKKSSEVLSLEVPATRINDKVSNLFHNPAIEDLTPNQSFRSFRNALIEANGHELFLGKAVLTSASHDSQPLSYEYDLYGNNGDWIIPLKEATLYDFLKHITFDFTKANIIASWDYDGTDEDLPFVFAPVRYGQPMDGDYTNYVEDPPPFAEDYNMKPNYIKPSISKYWLMYWGFKSLGYRIASGFLDSEYFRRQVMPWTWGKFLTSEGTRLDTLDFLAKSTEMVHMLNQDFTGFWDVKASNDSINGAFDNNGVYEWDAGAYEMKWTYLPAFDYDELEATFYLNMAVQAVATANGDVELRAKWFKNGVHVPHGYDNGNGNLLMEINAPPVIGRRDFAGQVEDFFTSRVEPGDIISCKIYLHTFDTATGIARIHASVDEFGLEFFRVPLGGTIDFASYDVLKKHKFLDFVGGVCDEFNLSIGTDPINKVVTIDPLHPYSLTSNLAIKSGGFMNGNTLDWNEKQDLYDRSNLFLFSDYERELLFKYKSDSNDGILKKVQDRFTTQLATGKYIFPDRFKAGKGEIENRFFSPTMHYDVKLWEGLGTIPGEAPQMICMIPENISNTSHDEAQNTFEPKSAYYKGKTNEVGWVFDGEKIHPYPFMFAVNYKPGGENDPILSYCDERIGPEDDYVLGKGLLRRFFLQRLAIMRNGQFYNTYFRLNTFDVTNWLHREHIICRGDKWELVEISNYQPLSENSTECFMRRWAPVTEADSQNVFPSTDSVLDTGPVTGSFDIKYSPLKCLISDIPTTG